MPPTMNVQIRLETVVWERYSEIAQAKRMPLAAYLRLLLEEGLVGHGEVLNELLREVEALRVLLQQEAGPAQHQVPIMLETLLLLRARASPQDKNMVQGEVERQNLRVWEGNSSTAPRSYVPPPPAPVPPPPLAPAAPAKRGLFGRR